jgi:hypothetical protein
MVDVLGLGLTNVHLELGLVDLTQFPRAIVNLRYASKATGMIVARTFLLDAATPRAVWQDVTAEHVESYEYQVEWERADGHRYPLPWQTSTSAHLLFSDPLVAQMMVVVIASGGFNDDGRVAKITATLRYDDPAHDLHESAEHVFTRERELWTWKIGLMDAQKRTYQYRYVVTYTDGTTRSVPPAADAWLDGSPGFLIVGDQYDLRVTVVPYLFVKAAAGNYKSMTVDLRWDAPTGGAHAERSMTFDADTMKMRPWSVLTGGVRDGVVSWHTSFRRLDDTIVEGTKGTLGSGGAIFVVPPPPK